MEDGLTVTCNGMDTWTSACDAVFGRGGGGGGGGGGRDRVRERERERKRERERENVCVP